MMKQVFCFLLVLTLLFGLVACGESTTDESNKTNGDDVNFADLWFDDTDEDASVQDADTNSDTDVTTTTTKATTTTKKATTNTTKKSTTTKKKTTAAQSSKALYTYLGQKASVAIRDFGKNYNVSAPHGSYALTYRSARVVFYTPTVDPDTIASEPITYVTSYGSRKIIDSLSGRMTYPELKKAVGSTVTLGQPEYYENLLEDQWEYALTFRYKGYRISYTWLENPQSKASISATIDKG